ncbi:hypothetical protein GKODMF_12475 [Candidatus Electrothrix gigas]
MNDFWKNLTIAIISFFLAFIGQYYYYQQQLEIKKFDIHEEFDPNFIAKPKFPDSKIEFKVDGADQDKVGKLNISIINYTSATYKDTPVKIKITPKNPSQFNVIAYSAVGEKEIADLVAEDKKMVFDGTSYNFSYLVETINREEKNNYAMQLRLLFTGNERPEVAVVAKGVGTRKYDVSNSPYQKSVMRKAAWIAIGFFLLFILVVFIATLLVVGPLISVATKKWDAKNNRKYAAEIIEAIKTENLQPNMDDSELREYVAKMLYKRKVIWWQQKTFLTKWTLGFVAPRREDYLVDFDEFS